MDFRKPESGKPRCRPAETAEGWPKAVLQRTLGDKVEAEAALGLASLSVTPRSPTEDSRDNPVALTRAFPGWVLAPPREQGHAGLTGDSAEIPQHYRGLTGGDKNHGRLQ